MSIEALIFDVDGTLIDRTIVHYYIYLRRRTLHPMLSAVWLPHYLARCALYLAIDKFDRARFNRLFYRDYRGLDAATQAAVFKALDAAVIARNPGWQVMAQVSLGEFLASPDRDAFFAINMIHISPWEATLGLLAMVGINLNLGAAYFVGLLGAAVIAVYHYTLIRGRQREKCFAAFLHNNWFGAVVFAGIVADALISNKNIALP